MLKRQKQQTVMLSSSSSRRQNLPHQNQDHSIHKPVGCLSGILHLASKYNRRRRRKFLTFGKKQGKYGGVEVPINPSAPSEKTDNKVVSEENKLYASSLSTLQAVDGKKKEDGRGGKICHARHLSCQVPRSPTLSVEIRQSDSVISPDNFSEVTFKDGRSTTTTSSPLSTTLVGLDHEREITCSTSAEEKRRMLLGALEKCDEDLKAIKNIIEALQTSSMERQKGMIKATNNEEKFEAYGNVKEFKQSPISVLDHEYLISPPVNSKRRITNVQQRKRQPRKKSPRQEDMMTNTSFFQKITTTIGISVPTKREIAAWSNKAIGESVDEVCNDVDCGERREVMRIGLVLQDNIFRDLVDQVVKELLMLGRASASTTSNCLYSPLPLEACKKRMRF